MANTRPEAAQGRTGFIYLKLAGHSPSLGDVRAETQAGMGSRTDRGTREFGSLTKLMPRQLSYTAQDCSGNGATHSNNQDNSPQNFSGPNLI